MAFLLNRTVLRETGKQSALWLVLYLFGYLHWDLRWLLIGTVFAFAFYVKFVQKKGKDEQGDGSSSPPVGSLSSGDLPAWVLNPDTQRAEWTNLIFKQLWPHLEEFVRQTLRTVEEDPQLQERLSGYHIKSVRFPTVTLGQIPPKLSGVKVHKSVHRDEIILDLNVQYHGDLHIGMEVEVDGLPKYMNTAKASIMNMAFTGQLRVHLRPLLQDIPFVGGVTVSFLQPPEIEFDLGGIANTLDLPGISHLLRHVIQDQLEQTIVMPNSISITLVPLDEVTSSRQTGGEAHAVAMPSGVLSVNVVEAKGLANKDIRMLGQGKSDPYVKVKILADGVAHTFKTDVIQDSLDPTWKLLIDVPVDNTDSLDDLHVDVWDEDRGSKDDFLGRCVVPLTVTRTAMTSGMTQDVWKKLEDIKRGSIHLEVSWSELKLSRPDVQDDYHKGVLVVLVDSCTNLLGGRTGLKLPNPSVKLELCGIRQATEPVIGSVNPVFAHRMSFLVRDPKSDTLKVSVVDEKREELLGTLRVNLSDLLEHSGLMMTNQQYMLTSRTARGDRSPLIVLSLAYRYIHRPKTNSFGVHRSLQELHKIMQTTVDPKMNENATEVAYPQTMESLKYIDDDSSTASPTATLDRRDINGNAAKYVGHANGPSSEPTRQTGVPTNLGRSETAPAGIRPPIAKSDPRPRLQLSLKYSKRTMMLSVVVHKVKNLQETRHTVMPSPYVKIHTIETLGVGSNRRVPNSKRKTKSQRNKINPIFEETLEYFLPPSDLRSRRLEVSVCSERGVLGRNVALGRCLVSLNSVHNAIFSSADRTEATVTDWHVLHSAESRFQRGSAVTRTLASSRSSPRVADSSRGVTAVSIGSARLPRRNGSATASKTSLNGL